MSEAACHQHVLVKNCEKLSIMPTTVRLACQTCQMGHMTPHPPPHIWACPHDQSQTTALLNPYLQDSMKNQF